MFERIIYALLYICALALAYFLIGWVLTSVGIHVPAMVMQVLLVMLVLIAILVLWRLFAGSIKLWPGP